MEPWEEAFDTWTPPAPGGQADVAADTATDLNREALLRLARELAEKRDAQQEHVRDELERLKQALRERAEAIAGRERELHELERRLARGKTKPAPKEGPTESVVIARERAVLERAQALEARERELEARARELAEEAAGITERERELAAELAAVQTQLAEALGEQELARAEREQLEERDRRAHEVEKELASMRIQLEQDRVRLETRLPSTLPPGDRERELRALEAKLDQRERELALLRQGIDAERNALNERERALRRREIAEVRQSFAPPLAPPSFSDGLAAFVQARTQR